MRLIGRSNQLTFKPKVEEHIVNYLTEIRPVYKIVDPDGVEIFIKKAALDEIDYSTIKSIEVSKDQNFEFDGLKMLNYNIITIKTNKSISDQKIKLDYKGAISTSDLSRQPLMILKLNGKTKAFENVKVSEEISKMDFNEIKSLEVIKGEKAVNVYGAKGRPGVVVITLKDKSKYKIE